MAKTGAIHSGHKDNEKRTAAKFRRGFGKDAMKKAGMGHNEWAQKHDPLFKVKGIKRHIAIR